MTRPHVALLLLAPLAVVPAALAAAPPAAGTAQGQLIVDGKPLVLKYAIAVSGPDTFKETEEAFMVLLTAEPLAADALATLKEFGDARGLARQGLALKYGVEGAFHMTIRHPVLKGSEVQQSGGFPKALDVRGPDRVAGTVASFPDGKAEDISGHKVQFSIAFNAPVKRRFAVEKPMALGPDARKLPAGGGDPGKAWLAAKCPKLPANLKDPKVLEKWLGEQGMLPSQKDLDEMSKQKGHKVTMQEALAEAASMVEVLATMAPKDCKVLGGSADATLAILQVEASVFGSRSRADAYMLNEGGKWSLKKQDAWKDVK